MRKVKILAGILVALMLFSLSGCGNREVVPEEEENPGVAVEVVTVGRGNISTENNISGTIVAEKSESVFVSLSARCIDVYVEEGDTIKAGQIICVLDLGTTRDNYELASLNYKNAQQSYQDQSLVLNQQITLAEKNYNDTKALFDIGAASQLEVDKAKLDWDNARASANSALNQLEVSMKNSQATMNQISSSLVNVDLSGNVRAPISGSVIQLSAAKDGFVSAGAPVATVSSLSDMKVSLFVAESLVSKLHKGEQAMVTVGALGKNFQGTIQTVASAANQTKLYGVQIAIPEEATAGLLNGMFADVKLFTDSKEDVVVIPTEAILVDGSGQYVVILDKENLARKTPVQAGLVGDGVTEILEGLSGGETLVVIGQTYLGDGDLARIVSHEGSQP